MNKRMVFSIVYVLIGISLAFLSFFNIVDEFWSGMGSALLTIGVIRLVRYYRINKNPVYREKIEIEASDERNHFIHNKAWAWAGYLFVIISAILTIIFKIAGKDALSMAASFSVCFMLILYWMSYIFLKRKY